MQVFEWQMNNYGQQRNATYQETYEFRRTTLAEMKTKWKQPTLHSNMATQQDTKSRFITHEQPLTEYIPLPHLIRLPVSFNYVNNIQIIQLKLFNTNETNISVYQE